MGTTEHPLQTISGHPLIQKWLATEQGLENAINPNNLGKFCSTGPWGTGPIFYIRPVGGL